MIDRNLLFSAPQKWAEQLNNKILNMNEWQSVKSARSNAGGSTCGHDVLCTTEACVVDGERRVLRGKNDRAELGPPPSRTHTGIA